MRLTFVDVGKVSTKAIDGLQHGSSVTKLNELIVLLDLAPTHIPRVVPPVSSLEIELCLNLLDNIIVVHADILVKDHVQQTWVVGNTPVWPIKRLDRLGVEVFYRLLVTSAHAVRGSAVSVKRVNGLGNSHLAGSHGAQTVKIAFGFLLQAQRRGLEGAVAALFDFVFAVRRSLDVARLHHQIRRRPAHALLEPVPRHLGGSSR